MNKRDMTLMALPLLVAVSILLLLFFLMKQMRGFETAYLEEARANIAQETQIAANTLRRDLAAGDLAAAVAYCNAFDQDTLRLTLIDSAGKVLSDSAKDVDSSVEMPNHATRPEIQSALSGTPDTRRRFSETLGRWMLYHAMPLEGRNGKRYVLRSAVSVDATGKLLQNARATTLFGAVAGAGIVLILTVYILSRVRRPLLDLQQSVRAISDGRLDVSVHIPPRGLVYELALGVGRMKDRLCSVISQVTYERNEKDALLEHMTDAVLLVNRDGEITRLNLAANQLFQGGNGTPVNLFRSGIMGLPEAVEEAFAGRSFSAEFTRNLPDAAHRILYITGVRIETSGDAPVLLTITDLTNQRKLESFRSEFIADFSHEIRTPLTCIIGAAEALQEEDVPQQRARLCEILSKQSARLNALVNDILRLASLEKAELGEVHDFHPLVLRTVAADVVEEVAAEAKKAGMVVSLHPGGDSLMVEGDERLLHDAIGNLVRNALKYSGGKVVEILLKQDGSFVELHVRDDGCGIAKEHCERIFERFYRVHRERSRALGGTGLGLSIVKHTAQLHGGVATVSSRLGAGSDFTIRLPLDQA